MEERRFTSNWEIILGFAMILIYFIGTFRFNSSGLEFLVLFGVFFIGHGLYQNLKVPHICSHCLQPVVKSTYQFCPYCGNRLQRRRDRLTVEYLSKTKQSSITFLRIYYPYLLLIYLSIIAGGMIGLLVGSYFGGDVQPFLPRGSTLAILEMEETSDGVLGKIAVGTGEIILLSSTLLFSILFILVVTGWTLVWIIANSELIPSNKTTSPPTPSLSIEKSEKKSSTDPCTSCCAAECGFVLVILLLALILAGIFIAWSVTFLAADTTFSLTMTVWWSFLEWTSGKPLLDEDYFYASEIMLAAMLIGQGGGLLLSIGLFRRKWNRERTPINTQTTHQSR